MSEKTFKGLELGGFYKPHYPNYRQMDKLGGDKVNVVADAELAWPFPNNEFDEVYASHVIERVKERSANTFIQEAYRVLKPNGKVRLACPDFEKVAKAYLNGERDVRRNLGADKIRNIIVGDEDKAYMKHLNVWDKASMKAALEDAGFTDVTFFDINPRYSEPYFVAEFGTSPYTTRIQYELYVEARKGEKIGK